MFRQTGHKHKHYSHFFPESKIKPFVFVFYNDDRSMSVYQRKWEVDLLDYPNEIHRHNNNKNEKKEETYYTTMDTVNADAVPNS